MGYKVDSKITKYQKEGFRENYISFLNGKNENILNGKNENSGYIDPDVDMSTNYYRDLTIFLNRQKKYIDGDINFLPPIKWKCQVEEESSNQDKSKIVCMRDGQKKFLLTSDQLGFSADKIIYSKPDEYKYKYPLVNLKEKWPYAANKNQCYSFISTYVLLTRTLGGAFVWPTNGLDNRRCTYNTSRGIRSYIEDRADLTLMEIKSVLDNKDSAEKLHLIFESGNLLAKSYLAYSDNEKINHMYDWLGMFKDFNEYVSFFAFDDFVDKDLVPINLETGDCLTENYVSECKSKEKEGHSIQKMDPKRIKEMLKRLENMIIKRSDRMELIINSSNKENG